MLFRALIVSLGYLWPYTNWSCLGSCLIFLTGVVAAFGLNQASFFYRTKSLLSLDRRSQNSVSVSFAVKTLPGVYIVCNGVLSPRTETVVPFQGGNYQ